ncbi:MAG: hypothetical protein BI182_08395 [Acetobacterium sp. MES1]|uniref:discoidin domain-containing protein n=1 Tax=Acetobacterium sp. MES1 TaxID=1899015 RepID=UPI000B9CE50A|nr:discoidin domain-containing protein [Acetobacterium sp. MES1]OXS26404.1 MAG: hypothetical protein BI182_08395 [Acetobacterium sp. MES1]
MAEQSGIFPSVNGDRKYFTSFFAEYFADFISNGIYPNPSTQCQVLANNDMTVTLKPGNAYINGYKYINDSDKSLSIETADGVLKRIDRIVIRYTVLNREIKAYVKKGTFASTPTAPSLQRDADMWELGIADIYVANGAVSISQANITDLRLNSTYCGIVHGVIDQVDTTTIFNQFQAWYAETIDDATTDIASMLSAFQSSFNAWFANLQDILDENTAGNLLNMINTLTTRMTEAELAIEQNVDNIADHVIIKAAENVLGHVKTDSIDTDGNLIIPFPEDYGRYSVNAGWDDAIFKGCEVLDGSLKLINEPTGIKEYLGEGSTLSATTMLFLFSGTNSFNVGTRFVNWVEVFITTKGTGAFVCEIYDFTKQKVIARSIKQFADITAGQMTRFTFNEPVDRGSQDYLSIRLYALNNSAWTIKGQYSSMSGYSYYTATSNNTVTYTYNSYGIPYIRMGYGYQPLTGKGSVDVNRPNVKKWGNLKFAKIDATGASIVCDLLKMDDYETVKSSIPIMTSNTLPSGVASASSDAGTNVQAYKAFDNDPNSYWQSSGNGPAWLQYSFTTPITPTMYEIQVNTSGNYFPSFWTLLGSDDAVSWTVLDVQNKELWGASQKLAFNINCSKSYKYFRLNMPNNSSYSCYNISNFKVGFENEGTVLKTGLTEKTDLSDVSADDKLRFRWTLSRNSAAINSPTVLNPSVTWEKEYLKEWEHIQTYEHKSYSDGTVKFRFPKKYSKLRLKVEKLRSYSTTNVYASYFGLFSKDDGSLGSHFGVQQEVFIRTSDNSYIPLNSIASGTGDIKLGTNLMGQNKDPIANYGGRSEESTTFDILIIRDKGYRPKCIYKGYSSSKNADLYCFSKLDGYSYYDNYQGDDVEGIKFSLTYMMPGAVFSLWGCED